jgi:hypothetical protein
VATASGTGSGVVSYSVARNATGATRTGQLTAGGQVLTVTQSSVASPSQPKNVKIKVK